MPPDLRRELRKSFRCPCSGERFDRRPYRLTQADLESDPGEQVLRFCEEASGMRPTGCPHRALSDPYVLEIISAHRYGKGALAEKYGGPPPAWVIEGVETYDAALNVVQVHDIRADRAEREEAARKAALARPR